MVNAQSIDIPSAAGDLLSQSVAPTSTCLEMDVMEYLLGTHSQKTIPVCTLSIESFLIILDLTIKSTIMAVLTTTGAAMRR